MKESGSEACIKNIQHLGQTSCFEGIADMPFNKTMKLRWLRFSHLSKSRRDSAQVQLREYPGKSWKRSSGAASAITDTHCRSCSLRDFPELVDTVMRNFALVPLEASLELAVCNMKLAQKIRNFMLSCISGGTHRCPQNVRIEILQRLAKKSQHMTWTARTSNHIRKIGQFCTQTQTFPQLHEFSHPSESILDEAFQTWTSSTRIKSVSPSLLIKEYGLARPTSEHC